MESAMAGAKDSYKPLRDADGLAAISRAIREAAAAQGGEDGGRQQDARRKSAPLPPIVRVRLRAVADARGAVDQIDTALPCTF